MKKTKELAKDSIFCAIVSMLIILFNFISMWDYMYISMIITIFMGCYFQNKNITRVVMSGIVILAVSLLVINPLFVLVIIFPSITMGVVGSILLKHKVKFWFYFVIFSLLCFTLNVVMELLFIKYIIGMDLVQYILSDDIFGISEQLGQFASLVVVSYMIVIAIISLLEVLILYNVNKIYIKRIMPLIGEKYN